MTVKNKLWNQLFPFLVVDRDCVYRANTSGHFRIELLSLGNVSSVVIGLELVASNERRFTRITIFDELLPLMDAVEDSCTGIAVKFDVHC